MALITNYTTLIAEVKLWLNQVPTDDTVKGWIQLAEADFRRTLATLDNEERSKATVPSGGFIALPDGFNGLRQAYIVGSPDKPLTFISPSELTSLGTVSGDPFYISIMDGQFKFAPDAEGSEIEVIYFRKLIDLSDSNATNFLVTDYPDVYLAGTLAVAQKFLRDDQDAAQHKAIVDSWILDMQAQDARRKYSGQRKQVGVNPVVSRLT